MSTEVNDQELYFEWYLQELETAGFIERWDREPEKMLVIPPYIHQREKHMQKKENKVEDFALLYALEYSYDYRIVWNHEKALHVFLDVFDPEKPFIFGQPHFVAQWMNVNGFTELISLVDVKAHNVAARFNAGMTSAYTFPIIQKILMFMRGIFVNKVIPINSGKHGVNSCLFAKTFTPNRYLFTDKSQQKRKIPFRTVTLNSYVKRQRTNLETYLEQERSKNSQQTLL